LSWISVHKDYSEYLLKTITIRGPKASGCMLEIERPDLKRRPNPFNTN
jgi:hypothetical protein